jgi:hypothetical protein
VLDAVGEVADLVDGAADLLIVLTGERILDVPADALLRLIRGRLSLALALAVHHCLQTRKLRGDDIWVARAWH